MGNCLDQYRAAIGVFYTKCHNILKRTCFTIFKLAYLLDFIQSLLLMALKRRVRFLSHLSIWLNFFVQFFMFSIILLSGDIETNPGPCVENSLDIIHINIRSIRNKIDSLLYLVQDLIYYVLLRLIYIQILVMTVCV